MFSLPLTLHRWTPRPHLIFFEEEHELSRWGESLHFPEHFATRKLFLFQQDLSKSQPAQCQRLITCHDAGLAIWKWFQGKSVRGFFTFFSLTRVKEELLFIHAGPSGMMCGWHFPLAALLLEIQGRKDCQRLTSAVSSLSLSTTHLSSSENNWTEPLGFSFSHLQTYGCKQHMWGRWQDENVPTQQ